MRFRAPTVLLLAALVILPLGGGGDLAAQEPTVEAYYQGLADHFGLPASEVWVLSEWQIDPEEVPVALLVARQGGVSPDALMALKRAGRSWSELAQRYDVGASAFHVPLPPGTDAGSLASAYERFEATPVEGWDELSLSDGELVGLINLKVISEHLDIPPAQVLAARARTGSYVEAYRSLIRSRG